MRGEGYLTKTGQYALVYSKGKSRTSDLFVMKTLPNGLNLPRYGLSVSKRVGNAVIRNRVKRMLREILRTKPLESGWDIMLIVRSLAANANYTEMDKSIDDLLSQAQLLRSPEETVRLGIS